MWIWWLRVMISGSMTELTLFESFHPPRTNWAISSTDSCSLDTMTSDCCSSVKRGLLASCWRRRCVTRKPRFVASADRRFVCSRTVIDWISSVGTAVKPFLQIASERRSVCLRFRAYATVFSCRDYRMRILGSLASHGGSWVVVRVETTSVGFLWMVAMMRGCDV